MPAKAAPLVAIVTGDTYSDLMRRVGRHRLLSSEEEIALAKRIERGDFTAKTYLVEHNYRLVKGIAPSFLNQGLSIEDLFSEGVIGLIRAAEKFDWRKRYKFSTYATFWIRQSMQRAVENKGHTIRIPVHKGQALRRVKRQLTALTAELGHEPSIPELAAHLGWDKKETEDFEFLLRADRAPTSLDKPVGESRETPLGNLLQDTENLSIQEEVEETLRSSRLLELVEELPPREAAVLKLFYGLTGQEPLTMTAIAHRQKTTAPAVSKLKSKGVARLKRKHGEELRNLFSDALPKTELEPAVAI